MLCRRAALLYCRNRKSHNVVWDTSYLNSLATKKREPVILNKVDKRYETDEDFEDHDSDSVAETLEKGISFKSFSK